MELEKNIMFITPTFQNPYQRYCLLKQSVIIKGIIQKVIKTVLQVEKALKENK